MSKIRVMLAEDQSLVRQGLTGLLEACDNMEVVGQVEDGADVCAGVERYRPDVLLLDIQMPRMTGIEALRQMQERKVMVPTLILTTFDESQLVLDGVEAGAQGYLLKDASFESLVSAIEKVHSGQSLVESSIVERVTGERSATGERLSDLAEIEALTDRELKILRLIACGFNNQEISQSIHKTEGRVKNQVSAILKKLKATDRTHAVLKAINLEILR